MSTSGLLKTLAFPQSALGKVGQDARAFRETSQPVGGAPARSLDVRVGPRGLRSLPGRGASPSRLRLRPELARG